MVFYVTMCKSVRHCLQHSCTSSCSCWQSVSTCTSNKMLTAAHFMATGVTVKEFLILTYRNFNHCTHCVSSEEDQTFTVWPSSKCSYCCQKCKHVYSPLISPVTDTQNAHMQSRHTVVVFSLPRDPLSPDWRMSLYILNEWEIFLRIIRNM